MQKLHRDIRTAAKTPKGRRILLAIILLIIAAAAGGFFYWQYNKKKLIRDKITDTLQKKTGGLYQIHYEDLQLDEVGGNLSIANLTIQYDSIQYLALRDKKEGVPPILFRINIPTLAISGVKTPRALLSNEIVGKNLLIDSPTIDIFYTNAGKDSSRSTPTKEVYEQILGDLNMIKLDSLTINNATITTRSLKTGRKEVALKNAMIRLLDLAVDSASSLDTTRFLFSKNIELQAGGIDWSSPNALYNYSIDSVAVSSANKTIRIDRAHIDPTKGEDAFVKSLPAQDDRFDFIFNDIQISDVDFDALLNEKLNAENMRIGNASFKVYRDLSIARDKRSRVGKYPHQSFQKLPMAISIKKLLMPNCFIEYKEKNPRSNQAGKVQFYSTYAEITNVSNRTNGNMVANVSSRFLNKAPIKTTWVFYMANNNGRFDVKGNLGAMDVRDINVISEPMAPARMEKGQLNKFEFDLHGSDHSLKGTVLMLYEDLKVSLLERDKGSKELDKKALSSFAANFLIKNSNPSGRNSEPRIGQVEMERDPNRSLFYFIWKTIFLGIQQSTGIKKK